MKKLSAVEHTDRIARHLSERTDLNDQDLWMGIVKVIKSDSMELRAKYVTELINAVVDAEKANK
jgi:hypothetical protein